MTPSEAPTCVSPDALATLQTDPNRAGRLAAHTRQEYFGDEVRLLAHPAATAPAHAWVFRAGERIECGGWPEAGELRPDDHVLLHVSLERAAAFPAWLASVARVQHPWTVAPTCDAHAGTHKAWLVAAARIALGATVRVAVHHDVHGIRLAQIALGYGADTLAGPIEPERALPLAGVSRPTENTRTGLETLVRQAGFRPVLDPRPTGSTP